MKQAILIMGTYGSGKSTFYDTLLSDTLKENFIHINIADILKNKIEDIEIKHIANQLANDEAKNDIQIAIAKSKNIVIETNFASTHNFNDIEILKELKNNNYNIEGYFLYTDDVQKDINNKLLAYLRGDTVHIDDDTIVRHYNKSLENIEKHSNQFDKLHLIDNSNFEMETKKVLEKEKIENIKKYFDENIEDKEQEQNFNSEKSFNTNRQQ